MNSLLSLLILSLILTPLWALSVVDCDFEAKGLCGWVDLKGNSVARTNLSIVDPGHDHTCQTQNSPANTCGHWLTTTHTTTATPTQTTAEFVVVSSEVLPSPVPLCLTLWYNYFGLNKDHTQQWFEVMINNRSSVSGAQSLWIKRSAQSTNWLRAQVTIPVQSKAFHLLLRGTVNPKDFGSIGVDDIVLTANACPVSSECDLESGQCGWTSVGAKWTQGGENVYPNIDHTVGSKSGYYLQSSGANHTATITGSVTAMTATMVPNSHSSSMCLKFWYYIATDYRDQASYIRVDNREHSFYRTELTMADVISDALLNAWQPMFVNLPKSSNVIREELVTITLFTANQVTSIAIDDLVIQNHPCEHYGKCDFESDMCGYTTQGGQWLRSQAGGQRMSRKEPSVDVTTGTTSGWFAMLPMERHNSPTLEQAVLVSAALRPPTTNGFNCLSLSYYAVGSHSTIGALVVRIVDLTDNGKLYWLAVLNATTAAAWNRFEHTFDVLPLRFRVQVATNLQSHTLVSDVAIDDIQLTMGVCVNEHSTAPTPSPTPIPAFEHKWDCAFENVTCDEWKYDSNWIRTSYRNAPTGLSVPHTDHSTHTPDGGYLLWMPSPQSFNQSTTAIGFVNSTQLSPGRHHCVSFWYYEAEEFSFELDVLSWTKQFTIALQTVTPNSITRSWKHIRANVYSYSQEGPKIVLRFRTNVPQNGWFAIDELKVTPNGCDHTDEDYVYTFESLSDLRLTRLTPLNSHLGSLHYSTLSTVFPNAPLHDHTTGNGSYLLFMNQPNQMNTTWVNHLSVSDLSAANNNHHFTRCVRFAYQRVGADTTLQVFVAANKANYFTNPVFVADAQHHDWVMAHVQYTAPYVHKVVFAMSKHTDLNSYVAIDDLQMLSRTAKCAPPVQCDFDDDLCAYTVSNTNAHFVRFVAPETKSDWPGPAYDHTTPKAIGGGYLYLSGYPSKLDLNRSALITSPIVNVQHPSQVVNFCLSLWTQLTDVDASLTLTLTVFGRNHTTHTKLVQLSNVKEQDWSHHLVDIDHKVLGNNHEFRVQLTANTSKARTVVAIDDIALLLTQCNLKA